MQMIISVQHFQCILLFCSLSPSLPPSRKIKVWDLQAALDPRAPASTLCLRTLVVSVQLVNKSYISFIHSRGLSSHTV